MTSPSGESSSSSTPAASGRPRVGLFVSFEHPDPYSPAGVFRGQGVIVRVSEDGSNVVVAPLSAAHLQVAADTLTPLKPADVETSAPEPAES